MLRKKAITNDKETTSFFERFAEEILQGLEILWLGVLAQNNFSDCSNKWHFQSIIWQVLFLCIGVNTHK